MSYKPTAATEEAKPAKIQAQNHNEEHVKQQSTNHTARTPRDTNSKFPKQGPKQSSKWLTVRKAGRHSASQRPQILVVVPPFSSRMDPLHQSATCNRVSMTISSHSKGAVGWSAIFKNMYIIDEITQGRLKLIK